MIMSELNALDEFEIENLTWKTSSHDDVIEEKEELNVESDILDIVTVDIVKENELNIDAELEDKSIKDKLNDIIQQQNLNITESKIISDDTIKELVEQSKLDEENMLNIEQELAAEKEQTKRIEELEKQIKFDKETRLETLRIEEELIESIRIEDQIVKKEIIEINSPKEYNPFDDEDDVIITSNQFENKSIAKSDTSLKFKPKIANKSPLDFEDVKTNVQNKSFIPSLKVSDNLEYRPFLELGYELNSSILAMKKSNNNIDEAKMILYKDAALMTSMLEILWRNLIDIKCSSWTVGYSKTKVDNSGNTNSEKHTEYIIQINIINSNVTWQVSERFSKIELLNKQIEKIMCSSYKNIPKMKNIFPKSNLVQWFGLTDEDRNERKIALDKWLKELFNNQIYFAIPEVNILLSNFFNLDLSLKRENINFYISRFQTIENNGLPNNSKKFIAAKRSSVKW